MTERALIGVHFLWQRGVQHIRNRPLNRNREVGNKASRNRTHLALSQSRGILIVHMGLDLVLGPRPRRLMPSTISIDHSRKRQKTEEHHYDTTETARSVSV